MQLRDALAQIADIQQRMARAEAFRGYRSLTVAFSGLLAWLAAAIQATWAPNPLEQLGRYLGLWIVVAATSAGLIAWEISRRAARANSPTARRLTWLAVEQFAPCALAGGCVTAAIAGAAPEHAALLPGLWSCFFSLGVFASTRLLPRETFCVAGWYLLAGLAALLWFQGPATLSPWAMALTFGVGQPLAAAILYWRLERNHGAT